MVSFSHSRYPHRFSTIAAFSLFPACIVHPLLVGSLEYRFLFLYQMPPVTSLSLSPFVSFVCFSYILLQLAFIPSSLHSRFLSFLFTYHRLPTSCARLLSLPGSSIPLPSVSRTLTFIPFVQPDALPSALPTAPRSRVLYICRVPPRKSTLYRRRVHLLPTPPGVGSWAQKPCETFLSQVKYRRSDFYVPLLRIIRHLRTDDKYS